MEALPDSPRRRLLVLAIVAIPLVTVLWSTLVSRDLVRPASEPDARATELGAAIADIESGKKTTPLIKQPQTGGYAIVTFLAKSSEGHLPRIVSDVTGWGEHIDGTFDFNAGTMKRIPGTSWYWLDAKVVIGARIEYMIAYGLSDYRHDPHNPRRAGAGLFNGAPASEFVMPGYVPPQEFVDAPVSPAGELHESTIESRVLGRTYTVVVYTPSGYSRNRRYPLALFHYRTPGQIPRVLDWLIVHGELEPVVAAFVEPAQYGGDYPTGLPMRTFLTREMLGWLSARYSITEDAGRRALFGVSFGAKDAVDAALNSRGYDCLGLLVPGRRLNAADIAAIADQRNHRLRVAILAGGYDWANGPTAQSLRKALVDAGHDVEYKEVPQGHTPGTWNYHLRFVLTSLFRTNTSTSHDQ